MKFSLIIFDFSVLNCFYEACSLILRKNVEKRALYRHLENILLALDEICDQGIVMEIDPQSVYDRLGKQIFKMIKKQVYHLIFFIFNFYSNFLAIRSEDIPLAEQNLSQLYQQAKEQVKWSLFK